MSFTKSIMNNGLERIRLEVNDNGLRMPEYGHGVALFIRKGWNDACEMTENTMSMDELKDVKFLIERALDQTK